MRLKEHTHQWVEIDDGQTVKRCRCGVRQCDDGSFQDKAGKFHDMSPKCKLFKGQPKTEIKPGQIWRDKRDHARQIRVTWFGESWDKASKCVVYDYEVAAGTEIVNQRNGRTVKEKCFRGDYELLTDAPTEAQKERRGAEG